MINAMIDEKTGNLHLTCGDAESLREALEERGFWSAMCEGMESYSCNGGFTPFDPEHGNPFVGLTSALCVAECLDYADTGEAEIVGRFWFDPYHDMRCLAESLIEGKTMVLHLVAEVK